MDFSLLTMILFFVFRKTESCGTKIHAKILLQY